MALQLGIIGAGRIGIVHARTIAWRVPQAAVRWICDPVAAAAERLAKEIGAARVSADYREVLADPDVGAVLVCSSSDTHAEVVLAAAAAGKHIFCEKPLDLDLRRVDEILSAVDRARVKLQLGFNRRFDPDFQRVREVVASGAIGTPEILRITSRDPAPPPAEYVGRSGGMFMDMAIHDFDMARFVVGREVEEVHVAAAVLVDPAIGAAGDVDTAIITLRFAGGALGAIDNSRRAVYGYDQRVEVLGSKGMVANVNHAPHTATVALADGFHSAPSLNFFIERYTAAYEAEMRAFVECIGRGAPPAVTGADARAALIIGYAARRSLAEKRPVRTADIH